MYIYINIFVPFVLPFYFLFTSLKDNHEQVVDLVLKGDATEGSVEVNALNRRGFTPLDVLLLFQSEAGNREIEEILRDAGAMRAIELPSLTQVATNQTQGDATSNSPNDHLRTALQPRSPYKLLLEYFKYDQIQDSPSKVRNTLLVVAILIMTATYQAVLSPPGGVWQDDSGSPNKNGRNTPEPHIAGQTVMGSNDPISYFMFLLSNSIVFFTSVQMILILTKGFPLRMELVISVVALMATYNTCMTAIAFKSIIITVYCAATSAVIPVGIATKVVRNNLRGQRDVIPYTNQASV